MSLIKKPFCFRYRSLKKSINTRSMEKNIKKRYDIGRLQLKSKCRFRGH